MKGVLTLYQISEFDWRLNRVDVEVLDCFSLAVAGTFDLTILIILVLSKDLGKGILKLSF
jgi:hypothetical protein